MDIKKQEVQSSTVSLKIVCTPEILEISIAFFYQIQDEKFEKTIDSKLANTFDIPQMEFATA